MTTIDELGRRAAAAANSAAARDAAELTETGLERLQQPVVSMRLVQLAPRSRRWVIAGLVAAGLIVTGVVVRVATSGDETRRIEPTDTIVPETVTSLTAPQTTTAPTPSTTATTAPHQPDAALPAISVRYDALPPAYPAVAFASIVWPGDPLNGPRVAVVGSPGSSSAVVIDDAAATATVLSPSEKDGGKPAIVALDVVPFNHLIGPDNVLYGMVQSGQFGTELSLVAIPLGGDRAGHVVASASISIVEYTEAPSFVLGRGPGGVVDRRTGKVLLAYVDASGAPRQYADATHLMSVSYTDASLTDFTVHDADGAHDWHLTVSRDPAYRFPGDQSITVLPSSHGGAIAMDSVGPPVDPSSDFPEATDPVVAVLAADGSGTWYSLTDGWRVAASDVVGTILSRRVGDRIELARLDPPQRFDFLDQPAKLNQRPQFAVTLPTSLTTAPPCTVDQLTVTATSDGAMGSVYGTLMVHNTSESACSVSGVPDVAMLNDAGGIVQRTDPSVAATTGPTTVLVPDSWASAPLGRIASNVCGGQQSSQLRLTLAGVSSTIDFANGRPFDPSSCEGVTDAPNPEGGMLVEAFGPMPPSAYGDPFAGATVQLSAPATAAPGTVLQFDLVVTGGDNGIMLTTDDCPIYQVSLESVSALYLLHCDEQAGGVVINAGETVVFHLQLVLPTDIQPGAATLMWTAAEPAGMSATAAITITG